MDLVQVGATWLHLLATVALVGYYAVVGLIVLPAVRQTVPAREFGETIGAVERRALPVIVGALIVFLATGVSLMGNDPSYEGVGNVTGSAWATLLLAKHLVVLVMVGLGAYIDALIARRFATGDPGQPAPVRRLSIAVGAMTLLGAVVLLMSAVAQAT
ncbi:MAG TPA: CopD family protein [Candidatus Sulfomarinibacteraceae bacterium]|nr:CopD family protein [Candidatus Sulfomarinibacteraceae bacterium]